MKAIEVKELRKSYGKIAALKGISFYVKKGEIFGFLGMNGAGKTTTVRILTGVIKPDSGTAKIMGNDIVKDTLKAKERTGVLPEVSNAYPDLTAWQNLMLIARLYGIKKDVANRRAVQLMKSFGIYDRRNTKVRGFSKGMKQRLMFCMTLISDPDVIFLDEPTSGLDVLSAKMIREKISELASTGKTVFLTSHNMDEVNTLCDRVAIISKGKLVTVDTPDKIRAKVGGNVAIEVSFDRTVDFPAEFGVKKFGGKYIIYTTSVHETVCKVVEFASNTGARIHTIDTRTPTLEDAFLSILGVKD
jgi:ABC-2 type transport system ATP-binding protein